MRISPSSEVLQFNSISLNPNTQLQHHIYYTCPFYNASYKEFNDKAQIPTNTAAGIIFSTAKQAFGISWRHGQIV